MFPQHICLQNVESWRKNTLNGYGKYFWTFQEILTCGALNIKAYML